MANVYTPTEWAAIQAARNQQWRDSQQQNYTDTRTKGQQRIDAFLGADRREVSGEKTDWKKLVKGFWNKGGYQYSAGVAKSLDLLLGGPAEELHQLGVQTINDIIGGVAEIRGKEPKYIDGGKNFISRCPAMPASPDPLRT